ncbi:hypothetical protein ENBRE01_1500 [Enteropsectra breve]|nr:hypothetical protein ENBRE01_1500 [Enteropsectra breve]
MFNNAEPENNKIYRIKSCTTVTNNNKEYQTFTPLFSKGIDHHTCCNIQEHEINTGTAQQIAVRNTRIPYHWENDIETEINKLTKQGIIRSSKSPWNSRLVPIKKEEGSLRLCIDYRPLPEFSCYKTYHL